ncbi:exo-beta-N-acetylmuramidase NamZ domain-containing protein [Candidatus Korobacter versatilis]|nr:exo-beta-N-acetylmuramidase NamZ domain-containing protein [Candidatus Koribacter versatilis]
MLRFHLSLILLLTLALVAPLAVAQEQSDPRLNVLDGILNDAMQRELAPGAVVIIGHDGKVVYRKAFGSRALTPKREPMTVDTIFDMASLTKVIATTSSLMKLFDQGKIKLADPVSRYIPDFAANGKQDITVRDLMTHYSGLQPDLELKPYWSGLDEGYKRANAEKPTSPAGSVFRYSDINFIVLGEMVQKLSGEPLERYAKERIFEPLGMDHTQYLPPASWRDKIAPTEVDERTGQMLRGTVHDPTSRMMGGVAGHAGLFSTADDVAKFAQAILDNDGRIWSPLTVEKMTTPQQPQGQPWLRGLGWDIDSPYATNRGELLPVGSFGHTGFTGTSLWIDPTTKTYIILLTNAVHQPKGNVIALRTRLATAVAAALNNHVSDDAKLRLAEITGYGETNPSSRRVVARNATVLNGIDVLEKNGFEALKAKNGGKLRIGVVTNQTGFDAQGRRTIDVLAHAPGVELTAIFSPEHGIAGALDQTNVGNSKDAVTGVTIYSVYGGSDAKKRPSQDALAKLDAVVYDIQDAGVRFYTYEATLGYFLEACAKAGKEFIVLDRPDPIGGVSVQGPVSDPGTESFVNYTSIPPRHGMTVGELAKLYNETRNIHAKLTVVKMQGWERGDWFDSTGQLWINPSPNLRSLTEAILYPGVGLIEYTNISVGRGTDTPFEVVGAPWIKAQELAAYLNARRIPGVRFVPIEFAPTSAVYANEKCFGVNIVLTDREFLDSPELGVELVSALYTLYPQQWHVDKLDGLLVNKEVLAEIKAGVDPRRIADGYRERLEEFEKVRGKYLLY